MVYKPIPKYNSRGERLYEERYIQRTGSRRHRYEICPDKPQKVSVSLANFLFRSLVEHCNIYTCSVNCVQEWSEGFHMFSLITLLTLFGLIVLQPWSYIKAR